MFDQMMPQGQPAMMTPDMQRQQMMARMLMANGAQPVNPGYPGARASPWQNIAQLGSAGLGAMLMAKPGMFPMGGQNGQ